MKAFCTLLKNELKLNIRNMNMVLSSIHNSEATRQAEIS